MAPKLGKKVLKAVTFRHPVSYYSKFNYYEENFYNLFGRISSPLQRISQKTINDPNAEKRQVPSFTGIDIGGGIDLYLSQGEEAVAVSASEAKYRDKIQNRGKERCSAYLV